VSIVTFYPEEEEEGTGQAWDYYINLNNFYFFSFVMPIRYSLYILVNIYQDNLNIFYFCVDRSVLAAAAAGGGGGHRRSI
jgi:hypothetical protein